MLLRERRSVLERDSPEEYVTGSTVYGQPFSRLELCSGQAGCDLMFEYLQSSAIDYRRLTQTLGCNCSVRRCSTPSREQTGYAGDHGDVLRNGVGTQKQDGVIRRLLEQTIDLPHVYGYPS